MIEIKHLTKTFETSDGKLDALNDVSLKIDDGEIYGIIGMSGAGKSTLVRCINMLERPTQGSVIIDGVDVGSLSDSQLRNERRQITMIFQGFNLLMQQQPVARDLRTISAAMKMVTDMERIGDHAADISEMTILMSSDKPYRVNIEHVKSMASETMLMLIRAIEAYVEKNNDKAHIVMKQDDVVDELFDKVKAELIDFIREHPEDGEQAEDLLMVAKYFERIGDHATNIAEWVEFALDDKVRKS